MDVDTALDVLRRESGLLAVAAGPVLDRPVTRYPDWTVADLVVHTGQIHRWVTEIMRTRATERLPRPDVAPYRTQAALTDWFMSGAADLALELQSKDPATRVWTFSSDQTVGFWRRRMALETTIHRWDAQSATAARPSIAPDIAADGVTEALHVYLKARLQGRAVGGAGQRILLRATDTGQQWSVTIHGDGIELGADATDGTSSAPDGASSAPDGASSAPDATIAGTAEDLWLYLMGRRAVDALTVDGDPTAVQVCTDAIDLVPAAQR
jgi:uncharacterized protein (TIGR03083 family)